MWNEHMHTASIGGPAAWKFSKRLKTPHHTKTKHASECYTWPQTFDRFCTWEDNMKMGLRNMIQGVNWIYLTRDR
jgi:hypothetical protein